MERYGESAVSLSEMGYQGDGSFGFDSRSYRLALRFRALRLRALIIALGGMDMLLVVVLSLSFWAALATVVVKVDLALYFRALNRRRPSDRYACTTLPMHL
jgi:hypothetical protein